MGIIDLIKVSKKYGAKDILKEVSLSIDENDKIAIIGKNGCGKSTLMKIINSLIEVDDGNVIKQGDISMHYINQAPVFEDESVKDYMHNAMSELKELLDEYNKTIELYSKDVENEELQNKSAQLANKLDFYDAWNLDNKVASLMEHFELDVLSERKIKTLSGGEQKRLVLASAMLKKTDVLFLDEPTNHLDVYMVKFLEEYLKNNCKSIVLVSHDRYFIDSVATKIFEVENGEIRTYDGNYATYLQKKALLIEHKEKENKNLLKFLKNEEEWLAKGVRARRKRDEGRKERLMKLRDDAKANTSQIRSMSESLKKEQIKAPSVSKQSKKKVLFDIKNLVLKQGDKLLIEGFEGRILQRDKIAIVGKNGNGKSSFLKALLGQIPFEGRIKVGDFKVGYFDQGRNMLDDEKNLLETFCPNGGDSIMVNGKNIHVFGYLKRFLFPKEYLNAQIKTLSGGEKNRVALAWLFAQDSDCLILDEPTNDLDIATINILEEYLISYKGCVLLVSHDRYFVDKIAKKLFVIEDKQIQTSYLKYSEYLDLEMSIKELNELQQLQSTTSVNIQPLLKNIQDTNKEISKEQNKKKLTYAQKIELQNLDEEISELQAQIDSIKQSLSNPDEYNKIGVNKLSTMLDEVSKLYDDKVDRFLYLEDIAENG